MYDRTPKTLNPAQIVDAIEKGNVQNVTKGNYYAIDEEHNDFIFNIGEERYSCYAGKVHVEYDFELPAECLCKLHVIALQDSLQRQQNSVKETKRLLNKRQRELNKSKIKKQ